MPLNVRNYALDVSGCAFRVSPLANARVIAQTKVRQRWKTSANGLVLNTLSASSRRCATLAYNHIQLRNLLGSLVCVSQFREGKIATCQIEGGRRETNQKRCAASIGSDAVIQPLHSALLVSSTFQKILAEEKQARRV